MTLPYSAQDLLAFANDGSLAQKLNDVAQPAPHLWGSQGLYVILEETARQSPELFAQISSDLTFKRGEFNYRVISGLKKAWEGGKDSIDWDFFWEKITTSLELLLCKEAFWDVTSKDFEPYPPHTSLAPLIAELIHSGTKDDKHAMPKKLLPRTWGLIKVLTERVAGGARPSADNAMTHALNSPRGKVIEALVSHALRACRVADETSGSHVHQWSEIKSVFDKELERCRKGNYEFSTLAGAYLGNLLYLDSEWLRANLEGIFPAYSPENLLCALDGLAYSPTNRAVYSMLAERGVIERVLGMDLKGSSKAEKVVERVAIAFLLGDEQLDSPIFATLFRGDHAERRLIAVTRTFWSVRRNQLSKEQKERIIMFWGRYLEWAKKLSQQPTGVLSTLGYLACFLETARGRDLQLLLGTAPLARKDESELEFMEALQYLLERSISASDTDGIDGVGKVLGIVLDSHVPEFDHEQRLKSMIKLLAENNRRELALKYAEKARRVSGMQELYDQVTRGA